MRMLVAGESGGIGGAVAAAARARGFEVVAFNRAAFDAPDGAPLPFGPLDALVFAAGVCPVASIAKTGDALFAETFRVNCGLFLSLMRRITVQKLYAPSGMRAVAVSSVSAVEGWAGGAAYCASKGALSALCRALDAELRPRKIRVAALEPRYVRTRMFEQGAARMGVPDSAAIPPEVFAGEVLAALDALGA